jgi:hypothetical protein
MSLKTPKTAVSNAMLPDFRSALGSGVQYAPDELKAYFQIDKLNGYFSIKI